MQPLSLFILLRNKIFMFPLFKISKLTKLFLLNLSILQHLHLHLFFLVHYSLAYLSIFFNFYAHLFNYLLREIINAFHFLWCQFEKGQWVYRQLSFQPFWWHAMAFDQLGNHLTLHPDLCIITYPISLSPFSLCVLLLTFSS